MTCAADGGYLMEINSATEHAFLNGSVNNATGLLPASNLVGRPYIGVIRKTPRVNWFVYANATTTNLSVTYWNTPGEPNGLSSGEDCVVVISTTVGNDGRAEWNDVACSTVAPFICEYNRPEVNPCTAAACNGTPSPAGACGAHDGAHGAGVASLGQRCDYDYLGRRCDLFPIDCTISAWSAWSTCEAATNPQCSPPLTASPSPPLTRSLHVGGSGIYNRSRTVITAPLNGGTACPSLTETAACALTPCPVNCTVGAWSAWSACSVTCNNGTKTRTRTVRPHLPLRRADADATLA